MTKPMKTTTENDDAFFREYTAQDAIVKYTKATAGVGISYLLEHDYKDVYLKSLTTLPSETRNSGIRMLEFGCGAGMNLIHFISVLGKEGIRIEKAVGTDFSPVLIEAAKREARSYLEDGVANGLEFKVARNETLLKDLSISGNGFKGEFHFVFGVNTIRYCHAAGKELECARDIFDLLVPGGVCVAIDMNDQYPCFRSDIKSRLLNKREEECVVPSLEAYGRPFEKTGFEILRKEHFCWIPHSAGVLMCRLFAALSPLLNVVAKSRAMRSLVVARKPK
jgi:SAM-dependent methyltransferase